MENASRDASSKMATLTQTTVARSPLSRQEVGLDIIDLTGDSPPLTPGLAHRPAPAPDDQRPSKRPRVSAPAPSTRVPAQSWRLQTPRTIQAQPFTSLPPSRSMEDCLAHQVVTIVTPLLREVPSQHLGSVSAMLFRKIHEDAIFQDEFRRTGGFLSPAFLQRLGPMIAYEIGRLKTQLETQSRHLPQQQQQQQQRPPTVPRPQLKAPKPVSVPTRTPARSIQNLPQSSPRPRLKIPAALPDLPPPATSATPEPVVAPLAPKPAAAPVTPKPATASVTPAVATTSSKKPAPQTKRRREPPDSPTQKKAKKPKQWLSLSQRPYLDAKSRKEIKATATKRLVIPGHSQSSSSVYHVDFTFGEIEYIRSAIRKEQGKDIGSRREPLREIGKALRKRKGSLEELARQVCLENNGLKHRDFKAVFNFLQDAVNKESTPNGEAQALRFRLETQEHRNKSTRQLSSLLLAREIEGNRGFGKMRRHVNFTYEFRKAREDDLDVRTEWTNCAGDIATISWVGVGDHFICGTTTHSDAHNQQYNKPGNLLLCSPAQGRLQAYSDHRIVRPLVQKGENGTEAMRESQDPWLYTSVVSSDYDPTNDLAFTSSFDGTVKVWKVEAGTMRSLASWPHEGNVNFVSACKNGSGLVATAADVPNQAVRVYKVDRQGVARTYLPLSGTRSWNEDNLETSAPQTWAYFPATMQWGIAPEVQHLLLVGYSPRSLTGDDNDIPQDKRDSGEICLWDCITNERRKVLTASTQNVFEVAWHPTQPAFVVATTPSGLHVEDHVRTQIRLFRPSDSPDQVGAFSEVQCLDCPATDINELTLTPCSMSYCYVTAAATDGAVYVWDTARGDNPIHRLAHGTPLEGDASEEHYDRERDDTGVKFTAWGTTPDRFYTGGSDGVVKVWNVRNQCKPLVRVLLEAPAPISSGMFSPDKTKLAIGDATGRVYLLSLNKEDDQQTRGAMKLPFAGSLPQLSKSRRVPKMFTRHRAPPAPPRQSTEPVTGMERGRRAIASGQIRISSNRCVGAVQGPEYASMGLYRDELHKDGDRYQPLLANIEQQQQENQTMYGRRSRLKTLAAAPEHHPLRIEDQHAENLARDLDLRQLSSETQLALTMAGVRLDEPDENDEDWDLQYQEDLGLLDEE